jgi:tetratricopeptide (TPR) repeat protein
VVYSAYDPELDRKVALKLLRARPHAPNFDGEQLRQRLRREAQAMARLSHPNVVTVFDVGVADGQVFVAMELIDGTNMAAWLRHDDRPVSQILSRFVEAGRGLEAAHVAGFVHRDFKPENVLIGKNGRVCVTDFGLVRTVDDPDAESPSQPSRFEASLTQPGNLVGTPAYMSPEQLRAEAADARADQFSFCLALYEALWGQRPFAGANARELLQTIEAGRVRRPSGVVSPRVQRAIVRGLSAKPADRFPSMAELLHELTATPRWRKYLVPAAAGLALLASLGLALRSARPALCADAGAHLAGVWDDARRARLSGHRDDAATRTVLTTLDGYARDWAAMSTQSCQATRLRGEQSEELLDLRAQCLRQRLDELRAAADVLSSEDHAALDHSESVLARLTPLSACADVLALRARSPRPRDPALRKQLESLERRVVEARMSLTVKDASDSEPLAGELDSPAARAYPPLAAALLDVKGNWLSERGRFDESLVELHRASTAALAAGDDEILIAAWEQIAFIIGYEKEKPDEGLLWLDMAAAAAKRLSGRDDLRLKLLATRAEIFDAVDRADEEEAAINEALPIAERSLPPENHLRIHFVDLQAAVQQIRGHFNEAAALYQKAIDLERAARGPTSGRLQGLVYNRAMSLGSAKRYPEELAALQEAAALSANLPEDHPSRISQLVTLGEAYFYLGRYPEARAALEKALPLVEKRKDVLGRVLFETRALLGRVLVEQHENRRAAQLLEAALPGLTDPLQIEETKAALARARR